MSVSTLVVSDNSDVGWKAAQEIARVIAGSRLVCAGDFLGTDILGADICFFGCTVPSPPEFAHLEKVLRHINLVLRRCALFAPGAQDAATYLLGMVADCGIRLAAPPNLSTSGTEIQKWACDIVKKAGEQWNR